MSSRFTTTLSFSLLLPLAVSCGDVKAGNNQNNSNLASSLAATTAAQAASAGAGSDTAAGTAGGGSVTPPPATGPMFTQEPEEIPDPSSPEAEACIEVNVQFEKLTPDVLLLIDMSGSMTNALGGGDPATPADSRWAIVHEALMNPTDGVVFSLQQDVNFGYVAYTSEQMPENNCPLLQTVPIAPANYDAIAATYTAAYPLAYTNGETPTPEAINAATAELVAAQNVNPKVLVLATDGEPDTCLVFNEDQAGARAASLQAVQDAYDMGVTTFVVSVGTGIAQQHLRELANAGQGLAPMTAGDLFYTATTKGELAAAFQEIVFGVANCTIDLNGEVALGLEDTGTVSVNGVPVMLNDPNGWQLVGRTQIQLLGTACDDVINQGVLAVRFPCDSFKPIR